MPVHIIETVIQDGLGAVPSAVTILKVIPFIGLLWLLKLYFQGASNKAERNMHSKVVMVTVRTV